MFIVEGAVAEQQAIGRQFAGQEFLRQRRPLIGQFRFVADQHQAAGEAFAPQSVDRLCAGLAAADDENGGNHGRLYSGSADAPRKAVRNGIPGTAASGMIVVPVAAQS